MAQADGIVSNGSGAAVRADINNQLAAVFTNHSGTTEPTTTYAYQFWADTTNSLLKIRNSTNTGWVTLRQLDGEFDTLPVENGTNSAPSIYFRASGTDTGFYSPGIDQVAVSTVGIQRVNFNAATEVVFNDTGADVDFRIEGDTEPNLFIIDAGTDQVRVKNLNGGPLAGARNRIINGWTTIDQRNGGASQTFTAGAALAYSLDRWYGYCTGANVTGQRVQGASVGQFYYRFTGAASVTGIGFGQRIEQINSADLAGTTATLSVDLANSVLTTVTWTAYYATTADTFGTLASPTRTQIATGTFTVTSTVTRYSTNISVPAAATTGIEIVFTVAAQTSGTWTIGNVQLEPGSVATPFERRSWGQELALCQRYYEYIYAGSYSPTATGFQNGARVGAAFRWAVEKRATPSVSVSNFSGTLTSGASVSVTGTYGGLAYADWNGNSGTRIGFECNLTGTIEL